MAPAPAPASANSVAGAPDGPVDDVRDAGETLTELLIAMVVLSLAVSGIVGALLVSTKTSGQHRRQVLVQNALRGWAEQVSAAAYVDCAPIDSVDEPRPTLPPGLVDTVISVQYWTGSAFAATCTAPDTGIQRIKLQISAGEAPYPISSQKVDVVVRKPCVTSC
jgi:Tfp pilus assembly protein PilV